VYVFHSTVEKTSEADIDVSLTRSSTMKTAFVIAASLFAAFGSPAVASPLARQEEWNGVNPALVNPPDHCPVYKIKPCEAGFALSYSYEGGCPRPRCSADKCANVQSPPDLVCPLFIVTSCQDGQTLVETCPCPNNACVSTSSLTFA
jgi:hypothetical protein